MSIYLPSIGDRHSTSGRTRGATRTFAGLLAVGTLGLLVLPSAAHATGSTTGTVTEYASTSGNLNGVTAGPDGNLWFTEGSASKVAKITTAGTITEFGNFITTGSNPNGITAGPDGNLWFTETAGNKVAKITTAGVVTEFAAGITASSSPTSIAAGPDGNLWFTEGSASKVAKITTAGVVTEFSTGITANTNGITAGPDGNLWFTETAGNVVGKITTAGVATEGRLPTGSSNPSGITAGPDGNLWVTENAANKVARISPTFTLAEFAGATGPLAITAGPDGNLWFTEPGDGKVAKITTAGVVTEFPSGLHGIIGRGMTAGPDGNLWFTEDGSGSPGIVATLALANTGVQTASATVPAGILSVALGQTSIAFGSHGGGTSSGAIPVGTITYTNTLADGLAWSASVAATDLTAGASFIPTSAMGYLPSALTAGPGGTGTTPTSNTGGGLGFTSCPSPGDLIRGLSYSCPFGIMNAGAATQGSWTQNGNTISLSVPTGQAVGSYSGSLQYSVTG